MNCHFGVKIIAPRQERLRALLERRRWPFLLVSNPTNVFYLTGFRGSAGIVAIASREGVLWVDPRYTLQAREQARGVEVREERGGLLRAAVQWLRKKRAGRVAYEDNHLTCAEYAKLKQGLPGRGRMIPAGDLIEDLRYVKDEVEVQCIREACHLTAQVFKEVLRHTQPGVRESDLAAEIECRMRRKGAEGRAFETIVASGPRGAFPHARPSSKLLRKNELVIFDLGAILGGYVADMTRTVYLGSPPRRIRGLYDTVRRSQLRAIEHLRAGALAGDADVAARRELARRGLARYFTHSTGHGVGLDIHERPRLGRGEESALQSGCVVTAEPGIYIEGLGGIRIEDTVLVGAGDPEILTPVPKDAWFIV
jgi:Xaa-Pro aminopeptidase